MRGGRMEAEVELYLEIGVETVLEERTEVG